MSARTDPDAALEVGDVMIAVGGLTESDLLRADHHAAEPTLIATERVTGKVLSAQDQRRLIDEAISGLDFSVLERTESR